WGREEIPALSAYMKVKSGARSRRELFDVAVLAKPPNRLYLQFLDDLGQERFRVVADGREVLFYDARDHTYQLLRQDDAALQKTLRIPVSVEELIDRLLLRIPARIVASVQSPAPPNRWGVSDWVQRDGDLLGMGGVPLSLVYYESQDGRGRGKYRVIYHSGGMEWSFHNPSLGLQNDFQDINTERRIDDRRFDTRPPVAATPSVKFH